jgi:tripartite-type tricarboxylate transporter receptor subunit TctC
MIPSLPPSIEFIKGGKLRALAVTTASRTDALPDVPVVRRFVPEYEASAWVGFTAPKDTPSQIVSLLNKEINAGLDSARIRARLAELGATPIPSSVSEFGQSRTDFTETGAKFIRGANIKAE